LAGTKAFTGSVFPYWQKEWKTSRNLSWFGIWSFITFLIRFQKTIWVNTKRTGWKKEKYQPLIEIPNLWLDYVICLNLDKAINLTKAVTPDLLNQFNRMLAVQTTTVSIPFVHTDLLLFKWENGGACCWNLDFQLFVLSGFSIRNKQICMTLLY